MLLKLIGLFVADIATLYVLHLVLHGWVFAAACIGTGLLTGWIAVRLFDKRDQTPSQ